MMQSPSDDIFTTTRSPRNPLPTLVALYLSDDIRRWSKWEDPAVAPLEVQQLAFGLLSALIFGDEPLLHHICEKVEVRCWRESRSARAFRKIVVDALNHPFMHCHLLGSLRTRRCSYIVEKLIETLYYSSIEDRSS